MLTVIFTFVTPFILTPFLGLSFWFVTGVLSVVFSLPVWLIILAEMIGSLGIIGIASVIVLMGKKSAN